MSGTLLCVGHGYTAQALTRRLLARGGWRIIGTTRSPEKSARLKNTGVEPIIWPGSDLGKLLGEASHVLVSIAPGNNGDPVLLSEANLLTAVAGSLVWAGYLSTTAVYGDHQGGWVNECTPLRPSTERGKLRVEAEKEWQRLREETGFPLHVFRLAGIYGPGRGPLAQIGRGRNTQVVKEGQVFNRIHVDDIARILEASMVKPRIGAVYNVCDDFPAPPNEVMSFGAELLGLPVPESVDVERADLSPMARSFYSESKRVSNQLVKQELAMTLRYPTYTTGFLALLKRDARD